MLNARDYLLPRYYPFQPLLILWLFPKPLYGYKKVIQEVFPNAVPYVNNNPSATPDENRIGEFLDGKAQSGQLPGVARAQGAAETPGARSGDYRFIDSEGNQTSADLYQPQSGNTSSISQNIIAKSGQAETVVVELGAGQSGQIGADEARSMVEDVINTPDQGVNRVIVIKDSQIIVDLSR